MMNPCYIWSYACTCKACFGQGADTCLSSAGKDHRGVSMDDEAGGVSSGVSPRGAGSGHFMIGSFQLVLDADVTEMKKGITLSKKQQQC